MNHQSPNFTMRQLLEAGVHFGHTKRRWNPKMESYLFGTRNNIHIIDLGQTVPLLEKALEEVYKVASSGGRILFVGTKRQAQSPIREYAQKCGQYFVNHRWLGGMMTNWQTVSNSIQRLKDLENELADAEGQSGLTKRELLGMQRQRDKLELALGGIKEMGNTPDMLIVLDVIKDRIAVQEANMMGLPVVGILDSNANPEGVDFPIPGNDDSLRAINLYLELMSQTILAGLQTSLQQAGIDLGAQEESPAEPTLEEESQEIEQEAGVAEATDQA